MSTGLVTVRSMMVLLYLRKSIFKRRTVDRTDMITQIPIQQRQSSMEESNTNRDRRTRYPHSPIASPRYQVRMCWLTTRNMARQTKSPYLWPHPFGTWQRVRLLGCGSTSSRAFLGQPIWDRHYWRCGI